MTRAERGTTDFTAACAGPLGPAQGVLPGAPIRVGLEDRFAVVGAEQEGEAVQIAAEL